MLNRVVVGCQIELKGDDPGDGLFERMREILRKVAIVPRKSSASPGLLLPRAGED